MELVACRRPCSTWDALEQKVLVSLLFCGALQLQFDNPAEARVLLRSEPFVSLRSSVRALGDYKAITNKELVGAYSLVSNFFRCVSTTGHPGFMQLGQMSRGRQQPLTASVAL
jgi:hypothetical protein